MMLFSLSQKTNKTFGSKSLVLMFSVFLLSFPLSFHFFSFLFFSFLFIFLKLFVTFCSKTEKKKKFDYVILFRQNIFIVSLCITEEKWNTTKMDHNKFSEKRKRGREGEFFYFFSFILEGSKTHNHNLTYLLKKKPFCQFYQFCQYFFVDFRGILSFQGHTEREFEVSYMVQ